MKARARAAWDAKLGVVEVNGATDDQRTTLYSSLYRLNLYPNSAFENTGTTDRPVFQHAVQSTAGDPPPSTPTQTGAPVRPGKVYVNNGFWDTYRTAWPAYSLLYPKDAGEMVDGFVQQYRDGGWVARWSSPGYANLMTGTSSDVAFADAYVKGVKGFDATDAYDAALKNATVAPPGSNPFDTDVGRKGLIQSIFLGYTPNEVPEGLSWGLEGYINDYGIGNMAAALADRASSRNDRQRYGEESTYFLSRAQGYVRLFDQRVGFFQGKSASGQWTTPPDQFDPRVWRQGGDYTETDGWNFAFHAPQDGRGLADLYGGRVAARRQARPVLRHARDGEVPGHLRRHDPRDARGARRAPGTVGREQPDLAPHPLHVRLHGPAVQGPGHRPRGPRAGSSWAARSGRAIPATRTTARCPPGTSSARWASTRCRSAARATRSARRCSPGRSSTARAAATSSSTRRRTARATSTSAACASTGAIATKTYVSQDDLARGARLDFGMGSQPSSWGTGAERGAAVVDQGRRRPVPADRRGEPGGWRSVRERRDRRPRAVRRHVEDAGLAVRDGPVGAVRPRPPAARHLLHADLGPRRRRRPERLGRQGLR